MKMIYLDNAATTNKKPREVYRAVRSGVKKLSANAGRGGYPLSLCAAEKIYETRKAIASLLNYDHPEYVVFTMNATYALNMAIKGLIYEKCHVITSDVEHNSVMRPIYALNKKIGVKYSLFNSNADDLYEEICAHIRTDTRAIISTLASNVTGKEIPFEILSRVAKENGLKLIVDASQYIGHKEIDLSKTPCDALCAPGHKGLFGIMGLGFVVFSADMVEPIVEGGSGSYSKSVSMPSALPERLEAGTLPLPAICGLYGGVRFISRIGFERIDKRTKMLTAYCCKLLLSLQGVILYSAKMGIVSFNMKNYKSEHLARLLSERNVAVRGGFHCSPSAHVSLGTEDSGVVRVSISYFTKKRDIRALYRALKKISKGCYSL